MADTLNVLVLVPFNESQRERLQAGAPEATYTYVTPTTATTEQVAQADVIVGNLAPERLGEATRLRLLQLNSAGSDRYTDDVMPTGTRLATASGAYGQAVSEHVFAMVLAMMKNLPAYRDDQLSHRWADHGPVTTLRDAHVLVMGTGDIGGHFARLCSAMGAHVTGVRRHVGSVPDGFEAVRTMDELPTLLGRADLVASFLPSTPETRGLADAAFFAAMRPGAYFANGGRGDLVVADELVYALESGRLAGAALDVTSPEPLPAESPLWDAPGALITPHVSGGFHLPAVLDNIAAIAAENLRRLQTGEQPRNVVRL